LLPFRKGLSYFAIDLLGLALRRPSVIAGLLRKLMDDFAAGRLIPLPLQTYSMRNAASAFHTMAQARHTGKIVFTIDDAAQSSIEPALKGGVQVRQDGTYLITGGFGGVGLTIAEWLSEQGAGCVVLLGRSAPSAPAAETIDSLRTRGTRIEVMQADVSDQRALSKVITRMKHNLPPLRGIVHAAAVLNDATVMRLTEGNFKAVFAPKAAGAWNLHSLTADQDDLELDFFVLFSSAASLLGSPGQANYAAANAFIDALAHHRRSRGKTAVSINWGPWAEVGLAAAQENRGQRLAAMGIDSIPPRQGAAMFGRLLSGAAPQVAVMPFRLRVWRQLSPAAAGVPFFAELLAESTAQQSSRGASKVRTALMSAEVSKRRTMLEEHLADQIAQVLRTSADRFNRDTPFNTLGMDSLMGLELRNRLESSLGVSLQATLVWSHPTIAQLVPHLAEKIEVPLQEESGLSAVETEVVTEAEAPLDDLNEQDASALLAERLAALDDEYLS
jgi:NAD(P)-dependent dehydrogenase (short-subunit alcohol dehydrogenase family)/acyl carrier protein